MRKGENLKKRLTPNGGPPKLTGNLNKSHKSFTITVLQKHRPAKPNSLNGQLTILLELT